MPTTRIEDRLAAATVVWNGLEISTDGRSYLNLPMTGGFVGDMELDEWMNVKRITPTNIPERLIALAKRYPRFRDVPSLTILPPPAAPAVQMAYVYHDPHNGGDLTDEPCGPLAWVNYLCGEGEARARISFAAVSEPYTLSTFFAGNADLGFTVIEQSIRNMQTLLNDPRVQAAHVRSEAGAPLSRLRDGGAHLQRALVLARTTRRNRPA